MTNYFERVAQDHAAIGLLPPATTASQGEWAVHTRLAYDWQDLYYLVQATERIGKKSADTYSSVDLPNQTPDGKNALELCQQDVCFIGKVGTHYCCSVAENKLLDSLDPKHVYDPVFRSPIVLTDGLTPIGIIKSAGETTCYSLVTDLSRGLIAGCFSTPVPRIEKEQLPRSPHAQVASVEQFRTFLPLRFSRFALPVAEREKLKDFTASRYHELLGTTPEAIASHVAQLLTNAEEIKLFDLEDDDTLQLD